MDPKEYVTASHSIEKHTVGAGSSATTNTIVEAPVKLQDGVNRYTIAGFVSGVLVYALGNYYYKLVYTFNTSFVVKAAFCAVMSESLQS